ncbi:unnamed protein product [Ceutorhynchus assimilis]|uniref:CRAL-TRIO domain-containing protein n=1 Tax=Ceutorhynchus assimilis TaxID=467358 RepID=A0A9N9QID0_9CUCU|nr:unnamed protein product [Ceutorhynchus assimilis]
MPKVLLELNKSVVYKQIEKELGKTRDEIESDVNIIQEWLDTQPHLPEKPSAELIQSFLLFNKFSIERAKQKLDMYYTIRGHLPEMFSKHPCSLDMEKQARISYVIPLPKFSQDCRRVIYSKFSEELNAENIHFDRFVCHIFNVFEIMLREDLFLGAHFIFDCNNFKLAFMTRMNPMVIKKASVVMEKVFSNRVTSINIVNYRSSFETMLNLMMNLLPEKVRSRIQVHKDSEALFKVFPKEILPKDVGGDEDSLGELTELWIQKLKENKDLFDQLGTMRVDESKRPTKLVNDDVLGFYGNFKKLDVD